MNLRLFRSVYLLALLPTVSYAQEPLQLASLSDMTYLQDIPLVLTATRLQQPLQDTPVAVTIIDRETITASGSRNIAELFRLVPGFQVGEWQGGKPIVTFHGLADENPRRMQVLVDGESVYQPSIGGPGWIDLLVHMEDIQRIEVVRGPNAASYGSNAFMGVVNIITYTANETKGAMLHINRGSNGIKDYMGRIGGQIGNTAVRLSLSSREDDGFSPNEYITTYNDSYRVPMFTLRTDSQVGLNDKIMFSAGYAGGERSVNMRNPNPHSPQNKYLFYPQNVERQHEQIRWSHNINENNEYSLQVFHNRIEVQDIYTLNLVKPRISNLSIDKSIVAERYDAEFQHTLQYDPVRFVWGVGTRLDRTQGKTFYNRDDFINLHVNRLFANAELNIASNLKANLGAMWEQHDLAGITLSPRLGLNYRLTEGHSLRTSASRAYRTPFAFEDYADYAIRYKGSTLDLVYKTFDRLKPERIDAYDIGYNGQMRSRPIFIDARLFIEAISDIITPQYYAPSSKGLSDPSNDKAQEFKNADRAHIKGLETSVKYKFSPYSGLQANYAYIDISSTDSNAKDFPYSKSAPRQSTSLMANYGSNTGFQGSLTYYWVNQMQWGGINEVTPKHQRLDMRVGHKISFGSNKGELALVVQNLLGDYMDFKKLNTVQQQAYLSIYLEHL